MIKRLFTCAISLILLGANNTSALPAEHVYEVNEAAGRWQIAGKRSGSVWIIEVKATRYEDLNTNDITEQVSGELWKCNDNAPDSCDVPRLSMKKDPVTLEFSSDLSSARVEFGKVGDEFWVSWRPVDPLTDPLNYAPKALDSKEGCPEGDGEGHGVIRPMRAKGTVFGMALSGSAEAQGVYVSRYLLRTDCPR